MTDKETAIVISMIFDPRCRLAGLIKLGWTPALTRKAKLLFGQLYRTKYEKEVIPAPPEAAVIGRTQ